MKKTLLVVSLIGALLLLFANTTLHEVMASELIENDNVTVTIENTYTLYSIGIKDKQHVYKFKNEVLGLSVNYLESELPKFKVSVRDDYTITTSTNSYKTKVINIDFKEINADNNKSKIKFSTSDNRSLTYETHVLTLDSYELYKEDNIKHFKFSSQYSAFKLTNVNYDITKFEKENKFKFKKGNEYLVTTYQVEGRAIIVNIQPK